MKRISHFAVALAMLSCAAIPRAGRRLHRQDHHLIVGSPPGGGYDTYARVFARHFGNHLPGKPGVVVQNKPAAGGLIAANTIYNLAPKDGTRSACSRPPALEPLLGNAQAKFETGKFTWLGNINKDAASCGVWKNSGVTSIKAGDARVKFGGSGPGPHRRSTRCSSRTCWARSSG